MPPAFLCRPDTTSCNIESALTHFRTDVDVRIAKDPAVHIRRLSNGRRRFRKSFEEGALEIRRGITRRLQRLGRDHFGLRERNRRRRLGIDRFGTTAGKVRVSLARVGARSGEVQVNPGETEVLGVQRIGRCDGRIRERRDQQRFNGRAIANPGMGM